MKFPGLGEYDGSERDICCVKERTLGSRDLSLIGSKQMEIKLGLSDAQHKGP